LRRVCVYCVAYAFNLMESIKETIAAVLRGLEEKKGAGGGFTEDVVKKVLTKKELAHIKVKYFKKGLLCLAVDSSVWLYALSLKKEEIKAKCSALDSGVRDIKFILGEVA
jgi:hypothetical protein